MKTVQSSTRGTTIVEVIVAFTVLLLFMGIFSQAMSMAGRMTNRSMVVMEEYHQLAGDYYLEDVDLAVSGEGSKVNLEFRRVTRDGTETGDGFSMDAQVRVYRNAEKNIALYEVRNARTAESEAAGE